MRLHVTSLPWFETLREHSSCAYTQKVIRFCDMMTSLGHEVLLYAGEHTDTEASELIEVMSNRERENYPITWQASDEVWTTFNRRTAEQIALRKEPGDLLCIIGGTCQQPVSFAHPDLPVVEWGIGYGGTFANFRVFESYAWMHTVYGAQQGPDPCSSLGRWYDTVIPNSYWAEEFPFREESDEYVLFMARLIENKGLDVLRELATRIDRRIVVAGGGDASLLPDNVEYAGKVGPDERLKLLQGAAVMLCPTLYVEPFGGVGVEAMMCGTPVVATNWGAWTETVKPSVSGYRPRTLAEWMHAVEMAPQLDRWKVHEWAQQFTCENVRHAYDQFLIDVERVHTGRGWYEGS